MSINRKTQAWIHFLPLLFIILSPAAYQIFANPVSDNNYQYKAQWVNSDPYFIDVDESGNVYVAGRNSNLITKYDSNGNLLKTWGGFGHDNGQFDDPEGIAVDDKLGLIYVTDCNNNRVQRFALNGTFLGIAGNYGTGPGQFINPAGIAVDQYSNVYVVDRENDRIQKFYPNGTFIFKFGYYGNATGQFNSPESVAVDSIGNIYVGDEENNRIQKFNKNGAFEYFLAREGFGEGQVIDPEDVAVDKFNNVYVADSDNSRIQRFDVNGTLTDVWGGQGSGDGKFNDPRGVAVDKEGNVYVADTGNRRIQKFIPTTGTLVAACTDNRGEPLSAADIISTSQPEGQTPLQGTTDENGIAEFRGVRPGAYTLESSRDGQVLGSQSTEVSAGQETRTIVASADTGDLEVKVVDTSNVGVEGATVRIIEVPLGQSTPTEQITPTSGIVLFDGLKSGTYKMQAQKGNDLVDSEYVIIVEGTVSSTLIKLTDVSPRVLHQFVFDAIPSPQTGRVSFRVKITAVDDQGVKIDNYSDRNKLQLYQADSYYDLGGITPTTITFSSGVWEGTVIVSLLGQSFTLVTKRLNGTESGSSSPFDLVSGELDHFDVTSTSHEVEIGQDFVLHISAKDVYDNVVTSYNGVNTLSASVGTISENRTTLTDGFSIITVRLSTAGEGITITTSGSGKTGISEPYKVKVTIPTVQTSRCLVSVATYLSELNPEIEFLRSFRDKTVLSTFAGSNFMAGFYTVYYSFSPYIASTIRNNEIMRGAVKVALYPLIGILHLTTQTYDLFNLNPEIGVILAGFVASSLFTIIYILPLLLLVSNIKKIIPSTKLIRLTLVFWIGSIVAMIIAEVISSGLIMTASTGGFIVATICLTILVTTRRIISWKNISQRTE